MFKITLKKARELCGMNVEQVGKYCNVSESMINNIEKNPIDVPLELLIKLRTLYGFPLDIIKIN